MISMFLYSHEKRELKVFDTLGREIVCRISEDDWSFFGFSERRLIDGFLKDNPLIDLSCVDVAAGDGVEIAERLRRINGEMYMIILTDMSVSPVLYIRPTIMASSLLMRPLRGETVKAVLLEALREHLKKLNSENSEAFLFENRDGRQLIPYSQIRFFESRNKKIYINTGVREYSFYSTLDQLEGQLPNDFLRCHRSFIVSRIYIKSIQLSQNIITLGDGEIVPLSRSYKSVFKELK